MPRKRPLLWYLPAGRVLSTADPLRVMTIGDSVMYDGEVGIRAALQATGEAAVTLHGFPGWGLRNDRNVTGDMATAIAQNHPEMILMMWSWDNEYAPTIRWPSPAAHQGLDVMLTPGDGVDGVAILQFPRTGPLDEIIDPATRQAQTAAAETDREAFDRIVSSLPASLPGQGHLSAGGARRSTSTAGTRPGCRPPTEGGSGPARRTTPTYARPGRPCSAQPSPPSCDPCSTSRPRPPVGSMPGGRRTGHGSGRPEAAPTISPRIRPGPGAPAGGQLTAPPTMGSWISWPWLPPGPEGLAVAIPCRRCHAPACCGYPTARPPSTNRRPTGSSARRSSCRHCGACSATSSSRSSSPPSAWPGGSGPAIGIPVGVLALTFDYLGIRRFWLADHRQRWAFTALYTVVGGMVLALVIVDMVSVLS